MYTCIESSRTYCSHCYIEFIKITGYKEDRKEMHCFLYKIIDILKKII